MTCEAKEQQAAGEAAGRALAGEGEGEVPLPQRASSSNKTVPETITMANKN